MNRNWILGSLLLAFLIVITELPMRQEGASEAIQAAVDVLSEKNTVSAKEEGDSDRDAPGSEEKETKQTGDDMAFSSAEETDAQTEETEASVAEASSEEETAKPLEAAAIGSYGILQEAENRILAAGLNVTEVLDYNWLLNNFYVVHTGTSIPEEILNPYILLGSDLRLKPSEEGPEILIYHTHSQEAFLDSIPGDKSQTIVGVGDYLTEVLTEKYGFRVLHHTGEYDVTDGVLDRDPAYQKALPVLEQILAQNPSIQCVIDLHRDGVADNVRLVTEVDGQPTARIMWFNGLGRDENGVIPGLENPYLQSNLAFSLQLRLAAMASYPGLTRVNYLKPMRYNQHLRMSALIEVGAQTNTVSEAMNAVAPLADLLNQVLRGKE